MAVSMYTASVPIFVQYLTALSSVLDKAEAHCEAKKLDQSYFMALRFYPDMFPFVRQVRAATDHALNACARPAGLDLPKFENNEASFADLKKRIATVIEFIKVIKPEQLDGQDGREITITFPSGERRFTGQSLLQNFALPNFYFHAATAYDLLRHNGVELSKRDFMGTPVEL